MKNLVLVLLLNLLGASFISDAQNLILLNGTDSLRENLSGKLKQDQPGAAIIITWKDSIIFEDYYGLANLETGEKLNRKHRMGIASMSKQFEGMAVLMLVAEGKLSFDDDIREYFPDLPLGDRKITIRQLLSHTSGLPELTQNETFMNTLDQKRSVDEIIDLAFTGDFRHDPGEKYQYCNTGYTIVVALIEQLSGMTYGEYLSRKIFLPLGMKNTYSCSTTHDAIDAVPRYEIDSIGYKKALRMDFSNLIGGGGIVSNAQDIAKWNLALLNGTSLPGNYMELWNPVFLNDGKSTDYGLGIAISDLHGIPFYYHPGMGSE